MTEADLATRGAEIAAAIDAGHEIRLFRDGRRIATIVPETRAVCDPGVTFDDLLAVGFGGLPPVDDDFAADIASVLRNQTRTDRDLWDS
jgi:hypothetical protein